MTTVEIYREEVLHVHGCTRAELEALLLKRLSPSSQVKDIKKAAGFDRWTVTVLEFAGSADRADLRGEEGKDNG